jgi:prepilin-type N-terminal cleavage/methylation domain-containing protein
VRGVTLIELMIAVAVLGIAVLVEGGALSALQEQGADTALRERARQCLDYASNAMVEGVVPRADVQAELVADLPEGALRVSPEGPLTRLEIRWRSPRGRQSLERVLLGRPR